MERTRKYKKYNDYKAILEQILWISLNPFSTARIASSLQYFFKLSDIHFFVIVMNSWELHSLFFQPICTHAQFEMRSDTPAPISTSNFQFTWKHTNTFRLYRIGFNRFALSDWVRTVSSKWNVRIQAFMTHSHQNGGCAWLVIKKKKTYISGKYIASTTKRAFMSKLQKIEHQVK